MYLYCLYTYYSCFIPNYNDYLFNNDTINEKYTKLIYELNMKHDYEQNFNINQNHITNLNYQCRSNKYRKAKQNTKQYLNLNNKTKYLSISAILVNS